MNTLPSKSQKSAPDKPRSKISAFVIAFNEEHHIVDCLESLSFCDEVIVIDSFSTDRTVEICEKMGAKVVLQKWQGYVQQKAFGLSLCTHPWVLNVDADERVSKELQAQIISVLERELEPSSAEKKLSNGFYINRLVYHFGRWWRRGGWYPEYRLRFFRKEKATWAGMDPHEKVIVEGSTERLSGDLYHLTYKDLDDQLRRLQNFAAIAAKEEFERGRKATIKRLVGNPLARFFKFYILKSGWREGKAGLIVAVLEGYYTFMKYAKLWELWNKDSWEEGGSQEHD